MLIELLPSLQKLLVPVEMRGYHGVYDLERKVFIELKVGGFVFIFSHMQITIIYPP